jgi:hypothetical protein
MRRSPLFAAMAGAFLATAPAQKIVEGSPEQQAWVATAIREWVADFEQGRLGSKGLLRRGGHLQPRYVAPARKAQRLDDVDEERITHLDALQKLLFYAEQHATPELADAVLGVAAIGLEGRFLDHDALQVRELGHWSLHRLDAQPAWFLVLRAAAGERVPVLSALRAGPADGPDAQGLVVGPARRVAALHLIGRKNWPVFRSTLEAALADAEPRVRLAAAEAMAPPWRIDGVLRTAQALARERHPVVSQALVRLLLRMLQQPPEELDGERREILVGGAMQQFGRCGWRTDMDLLDLVERFPQKAAVPALIAALDLELRTPDALVTAINKRASPMLRDRAGSLLRAMTGALIAVDDAPAWREFWAREQGRIVVPERLATQREHGTRAQFFGVPVTGGSIAFLIDTSGSMDEAPGGGPTTGPRGRNEAKTRLDAAKEQIVLAVQAMLAESQYQVLTFASEARTWTSTPVKPSSNSTRSLTELLGRLRAHGGTNLFEGLATALQFEQRRYADATSPTIDELFVLSDGEPTAGAVQQADELLRLVREANQYTKVRIHCVFTGAGKGADLLRSLAEQNGGVFVQR